MSKFLTSLLFVLLLAVPAWSQEEPSSGDLEEPVNTESVDAVENGDSDEAGATAEVEETPEIDESDDVVDPSIVDPGFEDTRLDEQTYEEDDDDFVPSEEIPADEPIPFPSNI